MSERASAIMTLSDGPWRRVPPVVVDLVLVAIAVADSALSIYDDLSALKASAIVLAAAGLMVRRRWPWLTFASVLPALAVSGALLAGVITVYSLAVVERRLWRLAVATVIVGVGSASLWVGLDNAPDTALSVLYAVLSATAPVGLGLLQRTYTDLRAAVDELNRSHEAERAHLETQILTQERTRIAREMHDVVSHHVSLVAVAGRRANRSDTPTATSARPRASSADSQVRHSTSSDRWSRSCARRRTRAHPPGPWHRSRAPTAWPS